MYENGIAPLHFKHKNKIKTDEQTSKDAKIRKIFPSITFLLCYLLDSTHCVYYFALVCGINFLHNLKPMPSFLFSEYFSLSFTFQFAFLYFLLYTHCCLFYSSVQLNFLHFIHTFFYFILYDNYLVLSIYT